MGLETILIVAGTAMSAIGSIREGQQQKRLFGAQATLFEREAVQARERAEAQAAVLSRRAFRARGARTAAISGSGVALRGTPLDLIADAALVDELTIANARFEGAVQANLARTRAAISRFQGAAAAQAGFFDAIGDVILGGAFLAGGGFSGGSTFGTRSSLTTTSMSAAQSAGRQSIIV